MLGDVGNKCILLLNDAQTQEGNMIVLHTVNVTQMYNKYVYTGTFFYLKNADMSNFSVCGLE